MTPPTINEPMTIGIPENQILLSFEGDSEAITFYEWFTQIGYNLFSEYLKESNNG